MLDRSKLERMLLRLAAERGLVIVEQDGRWLMNAAWDGFIYIAYRTSYAPDGWVVRVRGTIGGEELLALRHYHAPADVAWIAIDRSLDRVVAALTPMPPPIVDRDPGDEDRAA